MARGDNRGVFRGPEGLTSTAWQPGVLQTPSPLPKTTAVWGEPPQARDSRASRMSSCESMWRGGTAGDTPGGTAGGG